MKKKLLKSLYVAAVAFIGCLLAELGYGTGIKNPVDLGKAGDTVSILNVGQADSALISSGGKYCLIDAGYTNTGETDAVSYLKNAGIQELEMVVVTHFHTDHTGDIIDVMDNFRINNMIIPKLEEHNVPTGSFFSLFLDKIEEKNINLIPAEKGISYPIGNGTLTVLDDTYNDMSVNDTSVATLFRQGDFTFLSTGDGEGWYELRLCQVFSEQVTLLLAGHHGSSTSSTQSFIETVNPKMIAVSAGKDNEYGHPHKDVLELYESKNIPYNITFRDGTLVYSVSEKKLITKQEE